MPDAAPHFCVVPGCSTLTTRRKCPAHQVTAEHARPNYALRRWYRTPRWKALRLTILWDQGYGCAACGMVTPRLEVDHVTRHNGNATLFWKRENLQALCRTCHQRKTQRGE